MNAQEVYNSKLIVDMVCDRLVKQSFDYGMIPHDPSVDDIREAVEMQSLLTDEEWESVYDKVMLWQDANDNKEKSITQIVLGRFRKFPTTTQVERVFGERVAMTYKESLENLENETSLWSSIEPLIHYSRWKKTDMDAAIKVITNVLQCKSVDEMKVAYINLKSEINQRRKHLSKLSSEVLSRRREFVRKMGIWFPINRDLPRWKSDPRTTDRYDLMIKRIGQVKKKMLLTRSILQYVPKRRLNTKSCIDLDSNILNMERYLNSD